jgi:hypothetical protein
MGSRHACCVDSTQAVELTSSVGQGAVCARMATCMRRTCQRTNPPQEALLLAQLSCPLGVQRHQIIQSYTPQLVGALPRLGCGYRAADC